MHVTQKSLILAMGAAIAVGVGSESLASVVSQHAFTGSPGGTVAAGGGTVADTSGNGNTATSVDGGNGAGYGDGGVYSADTPTLNVQNSTGTASLNVTNAGLTTGTGAFSADGLTGLTAADIDASGGVTVEVWVRNLSTAGAAGHVAVVGGMFGVGIVGSDIAAIYGDNTVANSLVATGIDTSEWTHIAAVYTDDPAFTSSNNGGGDGLDFSRIELFVNGVSVAVDADGHDFGFGFLERGLGLGGHGVFGAGDNVDGSIYEPVVSTGALAPADFVTYSVPEPGSLALLGLGGLALLRRRR